MFTCQSVSTFFLIDVCKSFSRVERGGLDCYVYVPTGAGNFFPSHDIIDKGLRMLGGSCGVVFNGERKLVGRS